MTPSRYLKLPYSFDADRLLRELDDLLAPQWVEHFNDADYAGGWRCLALRSVDGKPDHIMPLENANFLDTEALQQCPFFQQVLDSFLCEKTSARLMLLEAGAVIKPHRDVAAAFEDGLARLHIPLMTHPDVTFCIDGETVHFTRGDSWYLNASCLHAVENRSAMPRIHLMLDCVVNPWLQQVFEQSGFVARPPARYGDPSINDGNVLEIIASLRSLATPGSLQAADALEATRTSH